ncbi:hypothetical protein EVAR_90438_1 [Eumeta japonica]|uniref:Uncharacterized protein n=1 Tax=Eumeta variegata TaxID=151549 RepID=A0A4C1Y7V9_EUMVA|nr:hypothetical protein EVAR_90438_1 [Eumeta japonica]
MQGDWKGRGGEAPELSFTRRTPKDISRPYPVRVWHARTCPAAAVLDSRLYVVGGATSGPTTWLRGIEMPKYESDRRLTRSQNAAPQAVDGDVAEVDVPSMMSTAPALDLSILLIYIRK